MNISQPSFCAERSAVAESKTAHSVWAYGSCDFAQDDNSEIAENGYNIAVSSYVEQADIREEVDIKTLNVEIARIVSRQTQLRQQIDAIVADLEGAKA